MKKFVNESLDEFLFEKQGVPKSKKEKKIRRKWESVVKKMKKHKDEIDNPWALTRWMENKGYKPHKK